MEPGPELDAAIARYVMQWEEIEPHLWRDPSTGIIYNTSIEHTTTHQSYHPFHPSSEILDMLKMEHAISEHGMEDSYRHRMQHLVPPVEREVDAGAWEDFEATPEQRCLAALQAIGVQQS